jgi:poly(A) polymerase
MSEEGYRENPISADVIPTTESEEQCKRLHEALLPMGVFDTQEGLYRREQILAEMNTLFSTWVKDKTEGRGEGTIMTFGSYRLGVHSVNGDIDTLCLAPKSITTQDFFDSFYSQLQRHSKIENVIAVRDAFVPTIKITFLGIDMDMLFASLPLPSVPPTIDLQSNSLIDSFVSSSSDGIDMGIIRSLNGKRVTDMILTSIPKQSIEAFRIALRCIKLWATQRGIYSNMLGYLGGVSWAIMTARICQWYPNADAATLVSKFFFVYAHWKWPSPIKLTDEVVESSLSYSQWNPINVRDRYDKMPILTPAYPRQNSAHNVNTFTLNVIQQEIQRAYLMFRMNTWPKSWISLWEENPFSKEFKHYMIVDAIALTETDFSIYRGVVESSLRFLVMGLEYVYGIDLARLNPRPLSISNYSCRWLVGIRTTKKLNTRTIDVTPAVLRLYSEIKKKLVRAQSWKEGMACSAGTVFSVKKITKRKSIRRTRIHSREEELGLGHGDSSYHSKRKRIECPNIDDITSGVNNDPGTFFKYDSVPCSSVPEKGSIRLFLSNKN